MEISWVLGSRGLLGSALCRALRLRETDLFVPVTQFVWNNKAELEAQIAAAVTAFGALSEAAGRWAIYWAAGVGNMGSSEDDMAPETRALSILLDFLSKEKRLMAIPGSVVFASSAGAIYAGSTDCVISEDTSPAPTTIYAREKLSQENLVRSFAESNEHVQALLARIATIYGPGQSAGKQQGLLAHIARCMLRNRPVQIYVPFDTIRDYIFSDDAAEAMIRSLLEDPRSQCTVMRIIASEQPTTIAEIISTFKKIGGRAPRIVTNSGTQSKVYPRRVRFQSVYSPFRGRLRRTSLLVGISQLMAAEHTVFVRAKEIRVV